MWRILIVFISLLSIAHALIGRTQSAGVRGVLMCDSRPASNVVVKLYDDDRGVDTDDLMAEGKTDKNGYFQIEGHTDEFTTIDPKLNIYHDCNDNLILQRRISHLAVDDMPQNGLRTPCQRKVTIYIPDSYVSSGKTPSRIYDVGTINLAPKTKGETRDCIH